VSDPRDPKREPAAGTGTDDAGIEQSLEEAALDRARAYVAELEAQASLLGEPAEAPAEAPVAPAVQPTREESDAQALEEFQRLRDRSAKKTL
jgi:hypothetical protein